MGNDQSANECLFTAPFSSFDDGGQQLRSPPPVRRSRESSQESSQEFFKALAGSGSIRRTENCRSTHCAAQRGQP